MRCCVLLLFLVATLIAKCVSLTIKGVPGIKYLIEVDNTKTKSIVYFTNTSQLPFRVNVWIDDDNANDSVLVVISQTTKVTSWELPYILPTSNSSVEAKYTNISKILCYDHDERNVDADIKNETRNFTVSLSTRYSKAKNVSVYVDMFENFFIQGNTKYDAHVSPSRPLYYSYNYPENFTAETVALKVQSEAEACLVVSLQQKLCPVEDLNFELAPGGMFHTVKTKGGLNIWKYLFPNGFYLVFNVKTDNQTCNSKKIPIAEAMFPSKHSVNISFEIIDGRTKNQYILSITLIIFVHLILIGFLIFMCTCYGKGTNLPDDFVNDPGNQEHKCKYFCYTFTAFGFYCMPAIQLVYFNQKNIDASGNLDKCYYNYYCSNPLYVDDFNHIFSNIGYLFFGSMFLVVVWKDSRNTRNSPNCGRQRHYGLYYAMGLALIFEGILSSTYHVCPNQSNFQFDTSFMYVMIMLVIGKLYQNRHCDKMNEASYVLFSLLAAIVILVSLESVSSCDSYNCHISKYLIITLFNMVHVGLLIYFGYKSYYRGALCNGGENNTQELLETNVENVKCRKEQWRFILGEFVIVSYFVVKVYVSMDFATNVLTILIIHASVYCFYCIRMEVCAGETICKTAKYLAVISGITWCCAAYFFHNKATDSALTPAESRELNTECYTLLNFYDTHDVWHLLSAIALFLTFKFLLVLDDDLVRKAEKRKNEAIAISQALIQTVDSVNESYSEI